MKNIVLFLLFIFAGGSLVAQCPGPAQRNALINLQRSLVVESTRAGQIPLTDTCGNQRYAQYVEVELDTIGYTPTPTGNVSNLSEFVIDPTGAIFYIDWQGNSIEFAGSSTCDVDWLQISDNSCPDAITDSIYKQRYASVGAQLVWPGAEFLVNDSSTAAILVVQGFRNARSAWYDGNVGTFSMYDHGGTSPVWYVPVGSNTVWKTTAGTPQTPLGSQVDHFGINAQDSTIQMFRYPRTRVDTQAVQNFLYTDPVGKIRSRPISYIVDSTGLQQQLIFNRGLDANAALTVSLGDSILSQEYNSIQHPIETAGRMVVGTTPLAASALGIGDWNELGESMYVLSAEDTAQLREIYDVGYATSPWTANYFRSTDIEIAAYEGGAPINSAPLTKISMGSSGILMDAHLTSSFENKSEFDVEPGSISMRSNSWNSSYGSAKSYDSDVEFTGAFSGYVKNTAAGYFSGIGRARDAGNGVTVPSIGNGGDTSATFFVQTAFPTRAYNWIGINTETDTTSNRITLYNNRYSLPNAVPSVTNLDTTIMAWAGNGTMATPIFMPLPAGGDGNGIYGGSDTVPAYTYARTTIAETGDDLDFKLGVLSLDFPLVENPNNGLGIDDPNDPSCYWCGNILYSIDTTAKKGMLMDVAPAFWQVLHNKKDVSDNKSIQLLDPKLNSTKFFRVNGDGREIIVADTVSYALSVRHLKGLNSLTPTISVDAAQAGTGASASMTNAQSSDLAGRFSITSGTGATTGKWATITFDDAFSITPIVQFDCEDPDCATLRWYSNTSTTSTEFFIASGQADGTVYEFNFTIIGGK